MTTLRKPEPRRRKKSGCIEHAAAELRHRLGEARFFSPFGHLPAEQRETLIRAVARDYGLFDIDTARLRMSRETKFDPRSPK